MDETRVLWEGCTWAAGEGQAVPPRPAVSGQRSAGTLCGHHGCGQALRGAPGADGDTHPSSPGLGRTRPGPPAHLVAGPIEATAAASVT